MKVKGIAVVGATGMVGRKFLEVLGERKVEAENFYLFASSKSSGKTLALGGKEYNVIELNEQNVRSLEGKVSFALFSAGAGISGKFAPIFKDIGAIVVDNSSMWRMHDDVPLVVPEVNPEDVRWNSGIIANPNCSTIQAVVALKPLKDAFGIKRIVYSTYQAVSGAGRQGYLDLMNGLEGEPPKKFPHPIAFNMLPHIDSFLEDGYTKEEHKMIDETRKILHDASLRITATTVRVPVLYGHSESINVEFEKKCDIDSVRNVLKGAAGVVLQDDPESNVYPMPIYAENTDEVYVGRVRIDYSLDSGINMWVVADNIRKGAATNAVQIVELMIKEGLYAV